MSEIQNSETPSLDGGKNYRKASDQVDSIENSHLSNAASLPKVLDRTANESKSLAGTEIKGHLFEFKLLLLFMVRANIAGYEFEIAANNEDIGGKFDDLILRYQVQDGTPKGKHWRYRYLQAKHKVDKTKLQIKASHLLSASANDKVTDYSLIKYFKSYCKMKARGDDIQDCIICTNIDFDYTDMEGIQLKPLDISDEKFFKFPVNSESSGVKNPALYKLQLSEEARKKLFESDDIRILASQMMTCATKSHSPIHEIFKTYHTALVEENVVDLSPVSTKSNTMKLHQNYRQFSKRRKIRCNYSERCKQVLQ